MYLFESIFTQFRINACEILYRQRQMQCCNEDHVGGGVESLVEQPLMNCLPTRYSLGPVFPSSHLPFFPELSPLSDSLKYES